MMQAKEVEALITAMVEPLLQRILFPTNTF